MYHSRILGGGRNFATSTGLFSKTILLLVISWTPSQTHTSPQATSNANDYDFIHIGMDLRLGMTREYVISSLAQTYRLQKLTLENASEGRSAWLIENKNNPKEIEGALSFEQDKLTTITRYWSSTNNSDFGFASALYRATANFKDEHRTMCLLYPNAKENPQGTSKVVFLVCGRKTLEISINEFESEGQPVKVADIMEILGKIN